MSELSPPGLGADRLLLGGRPAAKGAGVRHAPQAVRVQRPADARGALRPAPELTTAVTD